MINTQQINRRVDSRVFLSKTNQMFGTPALNLGEPDGVKTHRIVRGLASEAILNSPAPMRNVPEQSPDSSQ